MKKWQCIVCGLIYNEADGWPDDGIAPGTRWEDVRTTGFALTAVSAKWISR